MDKKGLNEIRTQLRKTRRMYETAQNNEMKLFDMLEKENIDLWQNLRRTQIIWGMQSVVISATAKATKTISWQPLQKLPENKK